jgi:hypothetical protein
MGYWLRHSVQTIASFISRTADPQAGQIKIFKSSGEITLPSLTVF